MAESIYWEVNSSRVIKELILGSEEFYPRAVQFIYQVGESQRILKSAECVPLPSSTCYANETNKNQASNM